MTPTEKHRRHREGTENTGSGTRDADVGVILVTLAPKNPRRSVIIRVHPRPISPRLNSCFL